MKKILIHKELHESRKGSGNAIPLDTINILHSNRKKPEQMINMTVNRWTRAEDSESEVAGTIPHHNVPLYSKQLTIICTFKFWIFVCVSNLHNIFCSIESDDDNYSDILCFDLSNVCVDIVEYIAGIYIILEDMNN